MAELIFMLNMQVRRTELDAVNIQQYPTVLYVECDNSAHLQFTVIITSMARRTCATSKIYFLCWLL